MTVEHDPTVKDLNTSLDVILEGIEWTRTPDFDLRAQQFYELRSTRTRVGNDHVQIEQRRLGNSVVRVTVLFFPDHPRKPNGMIDGKVYGPTTYRWGEADKKPPEGATDLSKLLAEIALSRDGNS